MYDQLQAEPKLKFQIKVYNGFDQIINNLEKRFDTHTKLYEEIIYLNSQYFYSSNLQIQSLNYFKVFCLLLLLEQ